MRRTTLNGFLAVTISPSGLARAHDGHADGATHVIASPEHLLAFAIAGAIAGFARWRGVSSCLAWSGLCLFALIGALMHVSDGSAAFGLLGLVIAGLCHATCRWVLGEAISHGGRERQK